MTLAYRRESACHEIELAKIAQCNPFFEHYYSFTGSWHYIWTLNRLYVGRMGLPKQTYALYQDPVETVVDILCGLEVLDIQTPEKFDRRLFLDELEAMNVLGDSWDEANETAHL